jgi:amidase
MRTLPCTWLLLLPAILTGCAPSPAPNTTNATRPAAAPTPALDLTEASIADLAARMASGELSSRRITQWYLDRIAAIDDAGPMLNAVVELNPDALAIADALDAERAAETLRGPLHGIPVLIKDNIDTGDRMHTTAGSLALAGHVAGSDAFVATRLRAAGAVILGKTNLSEWANFRAEDSSSGWSSRGGQTRNPYALDRNPCGSSSGTGAAISASLATVGVGTETDGSIVCPASANGLVGIKPTVGLVSRTGIIPIAASQDTAGPMARSVADAATLLGVLRGVDPADPATAASASHAAIDLAAALDSNALRGKRIGVVREFFGFHPRVDAALDAAIATLKAQGAEIVDPVPLPNFRTYGAQEFTVLLYEFKHGLEQYLATRAPDAPVRNLAELIAFNRREAARTMPWFGQDILEAANAKGPLTDPEYLKALAEAKKLAGPEGIDAALAAHRLDALLGPSNGPAWPTDWVNGDHFGGGSSQPAAVAGYPNITVPAGFVHGLPIGISFFGAAWSEPTLIGIAHAFEQAQRARRAPEFKASIDVADPPAGALAGPAP